MLTLGGLRVLTADRGAAGVALYRERATEIGLVLLDFSMPGLSAHETFEALRKINPDVRVILSSGFGKEDATRGFEAGPLVGFLQKPYVQETLLAEVRRNLPASEPGARAAGPRDPVRRPVRERWS